MNVIDSSGWLEYFSDGLNAKKFLTAAKDEENLIVPTICLYEVFKITLARAGENEALRVVGLMSFGKIVELDREIAIAAGQISIEHKLAMVDSLIYATSQAYAAALLTQDEHFKGLPGVQYIKK